MSSAERASWKGLYQQVMTLRWSAARLLAIRADRSSVPPLKRGYHRRAPRRLARALQRGTTTSWALTLGEITASLRQPASSLEQLVGRLQTAREGFGLLGSAGEAHVGRESVR